ncbi:hypothetical protein [Lentilactobacillus kosonis]|uniref:Uncharacterized protein n=1 Tax=Lentilactobacillus kosonis TaxID=2810561 RepID=A0A401FIR7_9LACO|nr:hypothetical protein [Lentilactobacillus kosonis]GAY72265.1 hypothetical protein NBRC111893_411 [Lentilactobacillus kosonis]
MIDIVKDKQRLPMYSQIIGIIVIILSLITGKLFMLAVLLSATLQYIAEYVANQDKILKKDKYSLSVNIACLILMWTPVLLLFKDSSKILSVILFFLIVGYGIQYLIKKWNNLRTP